MVAGEGVVGDDGGEVDEDEMAAGWLARGEEGGGALEVVELPVVADFREDDEIEAGVAEFAGDLVGDLHTGEADVGKIGAAGAGGGEGALGDVDREEGVAAGGELAGEDADGAADLEGAVVLVAGEVGEGVAVLGGFVVAGLEVPGIGRGGVDVFEVGGRQGSGAGTWIVIGCGVV